VEKKKKAHFGEYIENVKPDRIVLLGDIKHNVSEDIMQEKKKSRTFLKQ